MRLVPLAAGDRDLYRRLYTCPDVMRCIGTPLTIAATDAQLERMVGHNGSHTPGHRTWMIQPNDGTAPVGLAALHRCGDGADIGFMLVPEAQRGRFASHALALMLPHAFDDLCISRVEARSRMNLDPLLLPLGFQRAGQGAEAGLRWHVSPGRLCRPERYGDPVADTDHLRVREPLRSPLR